MKLAPTLRAATSILLVNLSGRGDKDIATVAELDAHGLRAMSRIDATFAALARARPQGADPVRHRRRSARRERRPQIMRGDGRRPAPT